MTQKQIDEQIEAIHRVTEKACASPETARKFIEDMENSNKVIEIIENGNLNIKTKGTRKEIMNDIIEHLSKPIHTDEEKKSWKKLINQLHNSSTEKIIEKDVDNNKYLELIKDYEAALILIEEAKLQIEYLSEKFGFTGSGNLVLSRLNSFLQQNK